MRFLCNICHVSLNTKIMGLVGEECFLYISYILSNLWMMGEYPAVLHPRKKNMLFVKFVFNVFLF